MKGSQMHEKENQRKQQIQNNKKKIKKDKI